MPLNPPPAPGSTPPVLTPTPSRTAKDLCISKMGPNFRNKMLTMRNLAPGSVIQLPKPTDELAPLNQILNHNPTTDMRLRLRNVAVPDAFAAQPITTKLLKS